ncbi:MAG: hypothetical protein EXS16_10660 [Gemmataceae bacterium]|nr:hypothetical protein [Gemmataceae bacterium]
MSRTRWFFVAFLLVGLLGISAGIWTNALDTEPGTRVSIVWPGAASFSMGGERTLEISPDLVRQKVQAEIIGIRAESKQTFIVRREQRSLELLVIAGNRAIQRGDLHFVLLDKAGDEFSSGLVRLENDIAPHTKAKCVIADMAVQEAAVVRIVRH